MDRGSKIDFPIAWARECFPAVYKAEKEDPPFAFMDNAGGTQVPLWVLRNVGRYYVEQNVNLHGPYRHSITNTEFLSKIRQKTAEFLGASSPDETIFGLNATTLIRLFATAFGQTLNAGDEIIISGLEHEANVTPWLRLQQAGVKILFWQPRGPEALLQEGDLKALLSERTRLVAVTGASNLLGTINDCANIAKLVHEAGGIIFVDGVHAAPHMRTNVKRDQIDMFVCSGYKIFGAHIGLAACSEKLLNRIPSLNHYFLDGLKLELGTQNFEGLAAMDGVFEYFHALAKQMNIEDENPYERLFDRIGSYERYLSEYTIPKMQKIDGITVYGITDPKRYNSRTPTVAFNLQGHHPLDVAGKLGEAGLGVNDGDLYAARIVEWLGLKDSGGVVRASLCHYNTTEEIDRLLEEIKKI